MLEEKYIELIQLLHEKNNWVTSKHLATRLDISSRTVKTYISFINDEFNNLISSSSKGYLLDSTIYNQIKEDLYKDENLDEPSSVTPAKRDTYILNNLLFNQKYLSLFELSEEILYVSVTTIRNDIQKLNKFLSPYHIKIIIKNNNLQLVGEEKDKRKLISYLIFKEVNAPLNIVSNVVNDLLGVSIDSFKVEINNILTENGNFINEVALENLTIHILVMVIRIKDKDNHISYNINYNSELTKDIFTLIQKKFQLSYDSINPEELQLLIDSYINTHSNNNRNISDEANDITNSLLEYIDSIYSLNLNGNSHFTSLMLHIESLIIRSKNNHQQKNHMTSIIKREAPMLFEIAVSAAHFIEQKLNFELIEDEISLLALHISRIFNNELSIYRKINDLLLHSSYLDNEDNIISCLSSNFPNQFEFSNLTLVSDDDLVISTNEIPNELYPVDNIIQISPLVTNNDISKIQFKVNQIINRRKKKRLKEILLQLTDEKRFYRNLNISNTTDLLLHMIKKLTHSSIVNSNFFENVLKREGLSSTVYEYFAIPHSISPDANMTSLSILISEKPIDYFGKPVNLIILSTLNKSDMGLFHEFIELISETLLEFDNIEQFKKIKNLESFIRILTTD